ncbi:hypothetical protein BD626DRAFT_404272 [Schizophyllum amplum]|uniref:BTB domain-containing protein n=1 Tax=Schizophyllum amplum TaxID=97359 RepID=A0A550CBX1_9AGAR|nr:hypothetical protein BD626DRAFT_404272 [Auriculariopsis ampla]
MSPLHLPIPVWFPDSDVTFRSTDGVLFKIHRINLDTHSGAFPPPEFASTEFGCSATEVVDLTEDARTLELLFQFIYPWRQPTLLDTPFEALDALAEAAEKYQIFSAMNICRVRMKDTLPEHPVQVMNYAARHSYFEILDAAAPLTISLPAADVLRSLSGQFIVPYVPWRNVLTSGCRCAPLGHRGGYDLCVNWTRICAVILANFGGQVASLRRLETVFVNEAVSGVSCKSSLCSQGLHLWRQRVEQEVKAIPPMRAFLAQSA